MNVTTLFCENATTRDDGRLDIHGVTCDLQAPGFPARHARIVLVGIVVWPRATTGRQAFRIDIVDDDGTSVFTVDGHTDVDPRPPGDAPARTQLVLPLENVVFPQAGRYRAQLAVAGTAIEGAVLNVLELAG